MAKKKRKNKFRNNKNNNHKAREPEKPKSRGIKTLVAIVLGAAIAVVGGVCAYEGMTYSKKPSQEIDSQEIEAADDVVYTRGWTDSINSKGLMVMIRNIMWSDMKKSDKWEHYKNVKSFKFV